MSYDENDRREIAARLRSKRPEEFEPRYKRTVLEHIFHSLFPKQVYPVSNWVLRMPYTLADLIDRPTCRNVADPHDGSHFECSKCGERWELTCGSPADNHLNYCPQCGAEVVEDE